MINKLVRDIIPYQKNTAKDIRQCIISLTCEDQTKRANGSHHLLKFKKNMTSSIPLKLNARTIHQLTCRAPSRSMWKIVISGPKLLGSNRVVSLSKAHLLPKKYQIIPRKRWLRPNMTEKLFTGTLRINQPTKQPKLL